MLIVSAGNPKGTNHPEGKPDRSGQGVSEHVGSVKRQHSDRPEGLLAGGHLSRAGNGRKEKLIKKERTTQHALSLKAPKNRRRERNPISETCSRKERRKHRYKSLSVPPKRKQLSYLRSTGLFENQSRDNTSKKTPESKERLTTI